MNILEFLYDLLMPKFISKNYLLFGYTDFNGKVHYKFVHVKSIYCWECLETKAQHIERVKERIARKYGQYEY